MAWDTCCEVTNSSLRAADFGHFVAMRKGSEKLHKAILHARGIKIAKAPKARLLEIRWLPAKQEKPRTVDELLLAVARFFNIDPVAMRATGHKGRKATLVRARAVAMVALHRRGACYADIARWMGFSDHTTVRHHVLKLATIATAEELDLIETLSAEVSNGDA